MADVKWIKLATDIFDNRKIRQIEKMPEGDSIIVIWLKLLCLAGSLNENGFIFFTREIPYNDEMMAVEFNRPVAVVKLALKTFERFGMIEIIDNIYKISSWEKYQNVDGMERIREGNRRRVAEHRERKRLEIQEKDRNVTDCNVTCNVTVTPCNAIEEDKEEDKEKDIEEDKEREEEEKKERKKKESNYSKIIAMYNDTCVSFPRVTSLSDARKKAINARLNIYTLEDFQRLFEKAEASNFLKGANDRNWSATFDWLIKDTNMAKVLDGNYDSRNGSGISKPSNRVARDLDEGYKMISEWAES